MTVCALQVPVRLPMESTKNCPEKDVLIAKNLARLNSILTISSLCPVNWKSTLFLEYLCIMCQQRMFFWEPCIGADELSE